MNANIFINKLKSILSEKKLNRLGKQVAFTKRERNITAFHMVVSLVAALGDKKTIYLSEILRVYNQLTGQSIKYKPFHNQLVKPELAELMREVTNRVFNCWINDALKYTKKDLFKFENILIQDGSSIMLHRSLKDVFPGRFSNTCPAAIELHATLNLTQGCFEKAAITPDSYSEREELPTFKELKGQLLLADRGYYSGSYIHELDKAGGFYVLRAKGLKAVRVHNAFKQNGQELTGSHSPKLCELLPELPKNDLIDMNVSIKNKLTRVVGYWSKKEKQYTFLVTNLSIDEFTATEIGKLYRLRWQVELLFKECKSYNNLRGFQTSNATLQEALIYVSLIVTTLKRFLTGCIEKIFKTEMSTMTVAKTTGVWWIGILTAIIRKHRKGLLNAVNGAFDFLRKNAARAHPKRDRKTGVLQYGVEPNF
ncbi:IS4 family transposase [Pseudoalteromonas sp. 31A1]|uniref:IS4 family transposase n=1 Tax=Pseudoalteromonas sp. 31A1 TaxID=2686351 RepID=UPI0013FD9A10|nr:IS4 family transposase [Pseudoalteromonas sp. 31A1]